MPSTLFLRQLAASADDPFHPYAHKLALSIVLLISLMSSAASHQQVSLVWPPEQGLL